MAAAAADVVVYGAGAIGLYLGGRLAASGLRVHFVGRDAVVEALLRDGLRVSGLDGREQHVPAGALGASTTLAAAPPARLALLTVKGGATAQSASDLAAHCAAGTPVISFQNGVDNPARLRENAPALRTIGGMVPFNVVQPAANDARQTTSGVLACEDCATSREWQPAFARAGLPLHLHADLPALQWGKLLLNLNNPVNALAGIPLREQLLDRGYRRVLAALQDEALRALAAAGIRPARVTPLPARWLPTLLRLPTPLFRRLAQRMLTVAPDARSSMYEDRRRGRPTEIDDLCGAVVRMACAHGRNAPINARMVEVIQTTPGVQFLRADALSRALGL